MKIKTMDFKSLHAAGIKARRARTEAAKLLKETAAILSAEHYSVLKGLSDKYPGLKLEVLSVSIDAVFPQGTISLLPGEAVIRFDGSQSISYRRLSYRFPVKPAKAGVDDLYIEAEDIDCLVAQIEAFVRAGDELYVICGGE